MKTKAMEHLFLAAGLLLLASSSQRSFVDAAPLTSQQSDSRASLADFQDDNVKELENLKHTLGKTLEMMKMHSAVYTNMNGQQEAHSATKEELNADGKLVASMGQQVDTKAGPDGTPTGKMRTKIDIPSKGIHKHLVHQLEPEPSATQNGNRRSSSGQEISQDSNSLEKFAPSYAGIQYSPLDMAEYVFWTGDEKGVTLAIEEFLREGMMSREEAISFLQEIKYNLDYLQSHYTQLGLNARDRSKENEKIPNGLFTNNMRTPSEKPDVASDYDITGQVQELKKKNTHTTSNFEKVPDDEDEQEQKRSPSKEDQYDQLLEKLRVADFLYTEYSLEEIIYQLAKVMFTQSLTHGSSEAQQALQKFTNFLESEADQGRISRALEKKVLDVLIAALTDTLNDHPELERGLNALQTHQEGQNLLRQIMQLSPEEKATVRVALSQHADQHTSTNPIQAQLKGGKNLNHLTIGLEKYKNL